MRMISLEENFITVATGFFFKYFVVKRSENAKLAVKCPPFRTRKTRKKKTTTTTSLRPR